MTLYNPSSLWRLRRSRHKLCPVLLRRLLCILTHNTHPCKLFLSSRTSLANSFLPVRRTTRLPRSQELFSRCERSDQDGKSLRQILGGGPLIPWWLQWTLFEIRMRKVTVAFRLKPLVPHLTLYSREPTRSNAFASSNAPIFFFRFSLSQQGHSKPRSRRKRVDLNNRIKGKHLGPWPCSWWTLLTDTSCLSLSLNGGRCWTYRIALFYLTPLFLLLLASELTLYMFLGRSTFSKVSLKSLRQNVRGLAASRWW